MGWIVSILEFLNSKTSGNVSEYILEKVKYNKKTRREVYFMLEHLVQLNDTLTDGFCERGVSESDTPILEKKGYDFKYYENEVIKRIRTLRKDKFIKRAEKVNALIVEAFNLNYDIRDNEIYFSHGANYKAVSQNLDEQKIKIKEYQNKYSIINKQMSKLRKHI